MYIIEYFIKWLNKNKRGNSVNPKNIMKGDFSEVEDEALTCEHKFMPVDSTGKVLACTKCGFVVQSRDNIKEE